MRSKRRALEAISLAATAFLLGSALTAAADGVDGDGAYRHLALFARAFHYIERNYHTHQDETQLVHGAIRGMVGTLDRHSRFMSPKEFADIKAQASGGVSTKPVEARSIQPGLAYLKLNTFSDTTADEVRAHLASFQEKGPLKGLVVDLRDNPGGLLDQAVQIADLWLDQGVIVTTVGRAPRTEEIVRAHAKPAEPPYPIALLVNERSASASEVLAGALRDHRRGTLVGAKTFGKGSVQTVIELSDGSALKLTVAHYLTPAGIPLLGEGLQPDIVIQNPIGAEGTDAALNEAIRVVLGAAEVPAAGSFTVRKGRGIHRN